MDVAAAKLANAKILHPPVFMVTANVALDRKRASQPPVPDDSQHFKPITCLRQFHPI